ncbi:hypothetical protein [Mucilaginibacter sp. dw_454]|uniref:hypothetical protein n=1 Tax=Mucilaginibacter sp. dw_454 TaxID=2720079 RepID=UPI001BD402D7|nr:hypothetical protein [Mucilaginibacter sp. dw_454]
MYLEAKETARLYQLLSDKLGNDTTEAMFKYIDNKTERAVESTIQTLATKGDIASLKTDLLIIKNELGTAKHEHAKDISESKAEMIKWMFIFWVGQVGATLAIIALFMKK